MTNEAGLQYEDLLKAKELAIKSGRFANKDLTPQDCYVNIEYEEKVWTTKDIPHHLSYIVACNVGCIPRYSVFLQDKSAEVVGTGIGVWETDAIEMALKNYLSAWGI